MTNGILSNDDSMKIELTNNLILDSITTNDNKQISAIIQSGGRADLYGLYDSKIEETTYTDEKTVYIADNIDKFNYYGATKLVSLKNIRLNKSLKELTKDSLRDNKSLTSVSMINSNLETVSQTTFANDTQITELVFPMTLKTIGAQACYNMTSLTSITIPYTIESIATTTFDYTPFLGSKYEHNNGSRLKLMMKRSDCLLETGKLNNDNIDNVLKGVKTNLVQLK